MKKLKRMLCMALALVLTLGTLSVGAYAVAPMEGDLTDLDAKIAAKGLDQTDMISLLSSSLSSIGKDIRSMAVNDILSLPPTEIDDLVAYIFTGLKALGVEVDTLYETLSSNKIINWFVNTYYKSSALPASVTIEGIPSKPVRFGKTVHLTAQVTGGRAKEIYWSVDGESSGSGDTFSLTVTKNAQVQVKAYIEGVDFVESEIVNVQLKPTLLNRLLSAIHEIADIIIELVWIRCYFPVRF